MEAEQKAAAEAKKQSLMERMFEKMMDPIEAAESTDGKGKKTMSEKMKGNQVPVLRSPFTLPASTTGAASPHAPAPTLATAPVAQAEATYQSNRMNTR